MQTIKKIIKQTFLYRSFIRSRERKDQLQWSAHDQELLELYSSFVSPGSLCFDIGANIGSRVRIFLKLGATVVAVEPQDDCVKNIKKVFGDDRKLVIIEKALGASEGQAEIMMTAASTLTSMSPEWIEAVKKSGRFSDSNWNRKKVVPMTTLDSLVSQYGVPSFIKIDVEGYEHEVIKGLSTPVKMICFEFTPEFIESTFNSIHHLQTLGKISLNYSAGESMGLRLNQWVAPEEMIKILSELRNDHKISGDVYVQFDI